MAGSVVLSYYTTEEQLGCDIEVLGCVSMY